jgi:hypothetical protein
MVVVDSFPDICSGRLSEEHSSSLLAVNLCGWPCFPCRDPKGTRFSDLPDCVGLLCIYFGVLVLFVLLDLDVL